MTGRRRNVSPLHRMATEVSSSPLMDSSSLQDIVASLLACKEEQGRQSLVQAILPFIFTLFSFN